ncbi:PepSY domain-containing protein [Paenibacillus sp. YN15]|uniref:PepSY domain-containing protein n=1 Tax=Paenibacillus sp. YN15 TaxID=1742774 RepID=UPI000DCEF6C2|nr:PepSY domain-containing protein [Paenibacillus sp. YN15]RAU92364.1 hypothetical protein DQG13_27700 [Paenibacillus sp. YN15]
MEEAVAIAKQLHGKNGPVQWSAELQRGVEIEGAKRDVWRVEALFSAGDRWWYSLDARSGKLGTKMACVWNRIKAPIPT